MNFKNGDVVPKMMFLFLKNVQSAFDKVFNKSNITTRQFDYLSEENTSKQMTKNLQHNYRFHVLNLHQKISISTDNKH